MISSSRQLSSSRLDWCYLRHDIITCFSSRLRNLGGRTRRRYTRNDAEIFATDRRCFRMAFSFALYYLSSPGLRSRLVRESLAVMIRNVSTSGYPNAFLLRNVLHEVAQTLRPSWLTSYSRVQGYGHHFPAFPVQAVKCIFEILLIHSASRANEAWKHVELPIVACCKD